MELGVSVSTKLASVGWDFADARTGDGPHGIHPYPAKFIPQIPRHLIELFYPRDGSAVLDPFCGSGTTLVEAMSADIDSVGIDLNPIATLISKVKTTPVRAGLTSTARAVAAAARRRLEGGEVVVPPIPALDHWFMAHVQRAIAAITSEIDRLSDRDVADALRVALSSIIVRVSNQDSDTRYAAVEKDVTQESVFQGFERAAAQLTAALPVADGLFTHSARTRIITKDILTVEPGEIGQDIGLVVTSPPYPNAYEYWLYHKYRMYWLGMDPITVRESEIGARPHYFKKNPQTEHDFERQMGTCFKLLARVMRKGRYACFVVGRSIIHTRQIDNEALLVRAAEPHGFRKAASVERTIRATRKSFNLAHGTINREQIVVFELEG
jgi:site-specific DNA-methyltransferase (cytosine-N4-specific)